jgi:serine/threonine protein kinase
LKALADERDLRRPTNHSLTCSWRYAQGIIHRDLKLANIKAADGTAKVLVFGLAKAMEPAVGSLPCRRNIALGTKYRRVAPDQSRLVAQGLPIAERYSFNPTKRARWGRTWWAHFEFTRINTTPTILRKKIEDLREAGATSLNPGRAPLTR